MSLDCSSETDILTRNGETALNLAVREGHIEIVKILFDQMDEGNVGREGWTALNREAYLEIVFINSQALYWMRSKQSSTCTKL